MSFQSLKKSRENLDELAKKLETKQTYEKDERYWRPTIDEGNGYAIIRFMPPKGDESLTYVQRFRHRFKGVNGWYFEECPTTVGINGEKFGDCPLCDDNRRIWNELGDTKGREIVSAPYPKRRSREMKFTSNVYVVSDPADRENEGKVFLYEYGSKIFDKIKLCVNPEFPNDPKFNPFNLWEGANFEIKIRTVDKQVNYDMSRFMENGPLADDVTMESAYNELYSLEELLSPSNYKDYDTLATKLKQVLGVKELGESPAVNSVEKELNSAFTSSTPTFEKNEQESLPEQTKVADPAAGSSDDSVDDDVAFFQHLANKSASPIEDD